MAAKKSTTKKQGAKKFYVTTPIYYPNDIPHLGHAYTTTAADVLARWHRLLSDEVFFLTGTDEYGKKIEEAAKKQGKTPKQFVDVMVQEFMKPWKALNISYDRFIRTTDKDHEKAVQFLLEEVNRKGDIYLDVYEGWYCTACEAYYTEKDAPEMKCPVHKKALEKLKEESYFFRLSKYQNKLLELYRSNPEFVQPEFRRHEIINRVKDGLRDLSISRTSFSWGIPLPFDKKHVAYVWFDALVNYYTATRKDGKKKFWPADVHIVGKDILWFHAVIWPAMLIAAGIELPKKIFAHGWLTVKGEKMGKSAGNAIPVEKLISYAGVDAARYFLLRECAFGQDGDFSASALKERYEGELANKLGNLVSRVSALCEKYGMEKTTVRKLSSAKLVKNVIEHLDALEFDKALNEIFGFIDLCNEYVQEKKPWETHDKKVLYEAANSIKDVTILLSPFMPSSCEKIADVFGFEISWKSLEKPLAVKNVKKAPVLFYKIG
jgi:methionyl-tRNA synthetase